MYKRQALAIIKNQFFGGEVNPERIAVMAMYHDTSEIFTGDLPTPIKYFNSEITHAYKDIEAAAELHLISLLPVSYTHLIFSKVFQLKQTCIYSSIIHVKNIGAICEI